MRTSMPNPVNPWKMEAESEDGHRESMGKLLNSWEERGGEKGEEGEVEARADTEFEAVVVIQATAAGDPDGRGAKCLVVEVAPPVAWRNNVEGCTGLPEPSVYIIMGFCF
jgi:hypothetical protein